MHPSLSTSVRAIAAALLIAASAEPTFAACTRLGFSVNDYGKDGPTKDAKGLLDKYIAKWAADHGIAKYRTGPKDVKCELFLDVIVFDEHTCRAEATVCWDGAPVTPQVKAEGAPAGETKPAAGSTAPVPKRTAVTAPAKPAAQAATAPAAATPAVKPIETGTLPAVAKPAVAPAAAAPKPAAAAVDSVSDQALAAAQKAAAAAERAAAAAERAAAAAQAAERASLPATAPKP